MSVTINHLQKVAYGLSIGTDIGDLERHWTAFKPLFCLFRRIQ